MGFPAEPVAPALANDSPAIVACERDRGAGFRCKPPAEYDVIVWVNNSGTNTCHTLVELFLLNSIVSLIAGERYMRDGLVAAIGVHFWVDIIWHVIWPLVV